MSERHRKWGDNCPAVDADFVLIEFNYGTPAAVVDYKHATEGGVIYPNAKTTQALGSLYNDRAENLPFLVARYWPDRWAFLARGFNEAAQRALGTEGWVPMSEREWVAFMHQVRAHSLTVQDERYLDQCNAIRPPGDEPCR